MIIFLREKFIAQIFMWVIAVVFVIATFLLYSGSSGPQQSGAEGEVVIRIGALEYTKGLFDQMVSNQIEYQQRNQRYNQRIDPKDVQKTLIRRLIIRAIEGSAKISDAEIEHYIRSNENLVNFYNQANAERVQQLKNDVRFELSSTSLRGSIRELELVTDTEVEHSYRLEGEKAKVKYIEFRHGDYKPIVTEDLTAEAEAYYEENKDRYKTEEQVNVKFIQVNPEDFVTQHDMVKYFTDNPDEFVVPEIVKARHILKQFPGGTRTPTDEQREETKKAAEELLKTVKEALASGTSFSDLAMEHSDGPSGERGGALRGRHSKLPPGDYFERGIMAKPFEEACFDILKPGEVSDLVETEFGFHIIKLEERLEPTPQTFPEVEGEIRNKLIQINGVEGAKRTADDLEFEIKVDDYETAIGKDSYKELTLDVRETGFFGKDSGSIPEIGSKIKYSGLVEKLFDLAVGVTEIVETKNYYGDDISAYFIVTVLGKKPPGFPEFSSIKEDVIDHLKDEKAKERALADAQNLFEQRTDGESLDDLVKKYDIPDGINIEEKTVQESNLFNLPHIPSGSTYSTYVSGLGDSKGVMFAAFDMSVGDVRGPFRGNIAAYIIELVERVESDSDAYDTDPSVKLKRYRSILDTKKNIAYTNWLAARENGIEIWIHEDYR